MAAAIKGPGLPEGDFSHGDDELIRSLGDRGKRISVERSAGQARVEGIWRKLDEIDQLIERTATNYRLERIDPIDRCILRQAIHEMLHDEDTPPLVAIDEAIELAKTYGSSGSAAFVNGILDRVLSETTAGGTAGTGQHG